MREFFINLFKDETFGPEMGVFNIWHILLILIVSGANVFLAFYYKKKDEKAIRKMLDIHLIVMIALYFVDFFIHPLMNNENALIVDKLPFHLCTSASLLIAFTRLFPDKTKCWYHVPTILGLVGSFLYLISPNGVDGDKVFCYRTLQTLIYHSVLLTYCIQAMVHNTISLDIKNIWAVVVVVVIQIVISLFANTIYSTPDHHYDWYFTTGSSFGISEYLMPILIFIVFNGMSACIYGVHYLKKYIIKKKEANN